MTKERMQGVGRKREKGSEGETYPPRCVGEDTRGKEAKRDGCVQEEG
jgi:hypothetical protein